MFHCTFFYILISLKKIHLTDSTSKFSWQYFFSLQHVTCLKIEAILDSVNTVIQIFYHSDIGDSDISESNPTLGFLNAFLKIHLYLLSLRLRTSMFNTGVGFPKKIMISPDR